MKYRTSLAIATAFLLEILNISGASADVRATTDGGLQSSINAAAGKRLVIPAGTYTTNGLKCVSNIEIVSDGPVKIIGKTTSPIFDFAGCSNFSLRGDFELIGNGASYKGETSRLGLPNGQVGINLYNSNKFDISGKIEIHHIAGDCISAQAPASTWKSVGHIRGVILHDCYRGIRLHNSAEYLSITDLNAYNNSLGIVVESGNNTFVNAKATLNYIGILIAKGPNEGHGQFIGCTANHNEINLSITDISVGQTFVGCHFIADQSGSKSGTINVVNSRGVLISGGQIGSNVNIANGGTVLLQGNYIRTEITRFKSPSVKGSAVLISKDNFSSAGVWSGNN